MGNIPQRVGNFPGRENFPNEEFLGVEFSKERGRRRLPVERLKLQ